MLREKLISSATGANPNFRWRGGEVSRIEGFSDAVFGFSITLIVVSLEVPKNFAELLASLSNFGAFGLSFLALISIWYSHYLFFRRYGLEDAIIVTLNTCLLFIVLLYIYPLKFLFTIIARQIEGQSITDMITSTQVPSLFVVYGIGFIAVYAIFGLMYFYAYRKRLDLQLTALEAFDTFQNVLINALMSGIGLVSIGLATFGGDALSGLAGIIYPMLIIPGRTILGTIAGRRRHALENHPEIPAAHAT